MGHHNRHYAGDPYANAGIWGPPTSTANFCEEDYAITLFIAEFMNTLTNLAYIYFAIVYPGRPVYSRGTAARLAEEQQQSQTTTNGASTVNGNGKHSEKQANGTSTSSPSPPPPPPPSWTRPDFLASTMWVLGFLSGLFHATLKHSTQYGDEIAMLLLAGALLRGLWPRSVVAAASAASAVVVATAVYLRTGNILHHVFAFDAMILVVGIRTLYLVWFRRPEADRRHYLAQFIRAVGSLVFGYTLWQIDLEKCSWLRATRASIGMPWALLLEFHGWWHIFTALGAGLYIRLIRDIDP